MLAINDRDRLIGAVSITNYINNELLDPGSAVTVKAVQHWIDRDMIPTGRFGRQIVASKKNIDLALSGQLPQPPSRIRGHRTICKKLHAKRPRERPVCTLI
jgi:hypothetical protein